MKMKNKLKIAFISYEYPPDAAYGGIATYVQQAAAMMQRRGHHVEVFTSSPFQSGNTVENGLTVHRILEKDYRSFPEQIAPVFARRHEKVKFDVIEGPEFGADARAAIRLVPDIPLVIKLHTPTFLTCKGSYDGLSWGTPLKLHMTFRELKSKAFWYAGSLLKGKVVSWHYTPYDDVLAERRHTLEADVIAAPSRSIGEKLIAKWKLDPTKVENFPYPYIPSEALLKIPIETRTDTITFLGRLEVRKGVLDLAKAIPLVLEQYPQAKFRFIGSSEHSPNPQIPMRDYLEKTLKKYSDSVEFKDPIPLDQIPTAFSSTDICVFPSIWDNFPNVCLEAMSSGRGVVGTHTGGMKEMLHKNTAGRIISPRQPRQIAEAVLELLKNPELRMELGQAARDRIDTEYSAQKIGALQEATYYRAIQHRKALGIRC